MVATASPTSLGKLRRVGASSGVDYSEILPATDLRDAIRCYWFLNAEPGEMAAGSEPALPDGSPELIFSLADPFIAQPPGQPERVQPSIFVVGQITAPFAVRPSGRAALVGVRLEAHAALWLAVDFSTIEDRELDLAAHKDGAFSGLAAQLASSATHEARAECLNQALRPLLEAGPHADWRVTAAVQAIRGSRGLTDIAALAGRLQTSSRTLQRLFARDVGVTPKYFARIVRFQQVFAAWRTDPSTLSRVALECGYFDHAHLVRDFKELAGVPPTTLRDNMPNFTGFFTA
jgi:AraC-like DNA-binding protein